MTQPQAVSASVEDAQFRKRKIVATHESNRRTDAATLDQKIHNPTTTHFEFMGPHGTLLAVLGLPITVIGLFVVCNENGCPPSGLLSNLASLSQLFQTASTTKWYDPVAAGVVAAWLAFHALMNVVLPGEWVYGVPLRTGDRLGYRINGFNAMMVCVGLGAFYCTLFPADSLNKLVWIADHFAGLAFATSVMAFALATGLYLASFRNPGQVILAEGGNSGYPIYDFWMGRELNPRILGGLVDLKYMCELRPGLIGWFLLDVAFAAKQYSMYGYVTNSMMAVMAFQGYYVVDALWNERAILTTMDITTDGFGFMLVFGDLVWVPFTYSLQARYLSMYPQDLSTWFLLAVVALNLCGLWIFRGANGQKDAFRRDPNGPSVRHLRFMTTKSGSRLLVSGWWGAARKINYTGDWLMALAWCLPCGFDSIVPYFYAIYFAVLLVHRAGRDEAKCRAKYGDDWKEYCQKVPFVFVPNLI